MFNVANKMVNDNDEAADIVQEVFLAFYQKTEAGKKIEYPKSWLYRATLNKSIDATKAKHKLLKIDFSAAFEKAEETNAEKENQEIITEALKLLTSKERALAVLYSEGLSYKEISEITGIKFTSVGKTLTRTLDKLGNHFKKYEHELH